MDELQNISAGLDDISIRSEAGEERFCRPIVYIEGSSVRILCRSYGIHIWMFEAGARVTLAQLGWLVAQMFRKEAAPAQMEIVQPPSSQDRRNTRQATRKKNQKKRNQRQPEVEEDQFENHLERLRLLIRGHFCDEDLTFFLEEAAKKAAGRDHGFINFDGLDDLGFTSMRPIEEQQERAEKNKSLRRAFRPLARLQGCGTSVRNDESRVALWDQQWNAGVPFMLAAAGARLYYKLLGAALALS